MTGGAMVAFNADIMPLLQNGTTLKINAVAVDSGQPISFAICSTAAARRPGLPNSRPTERRRANAQGVFDRAQSTSRRRYPTPVSVVM
ncbi:hypothetical protein AJ88_14310 [Mesorhizobium amorphae CCBAU 01583]|nr:hypothetical protein AJ88_14310 [Mesorhizobium amorphae CCBAU 01583]